MNEHEQLREQLWDLVYGLTTPEETGALHARIKSDRAAARMYAEVRLEADLIAQAAKIDDTSHSLPKVGGEKERAAAGRAKESSKAPVASSAGRGWSLHWLGAIGASALAVLMAVGTFWRQEQPRADITYPVSIALRTDAPLVRGLAQDIEVHAQDVAAGTPAETELKLQVAKADGTLLFERQFKTDSEGRSRVQVPADVIEAGNKLKMYWAESPLPKQIAQQVDGATAPPASNPAGEVVRDLQRRAPVDFDDTAKFDTAKFDTAKFDTAQPLVEATLDVVEDPLKAQLSVDQDWYQPGETVKFRAHLASAFTQRPPDVKSLHLNLVDQDGKALAAEETEAYPENGVVIGKFRLPVEAKEGKYGLTIQSPARGEQRTDAVVAVGEGAQLEQLSRYARNLNEDLAAADVKLQGETRLNRGLAMTPAAAPGNLPPGDDVRGRKQDQAGTGAAVKESAPQGSGGRPAGGTADPPGLAQTATAPAPAVNAPAPGGTEAVDGAAPAPAAAGATFADSRSSSQVVDELRLAEDVKKLSEASATTLSLVPPAQLAGKPLLVEARQGKVVIGKLELPALQNEVQERLIEKEADSERLTMTVPPQVSGPIDVYYFDNSATPPKLLRATRHDIPARNSFEVALADTETTYAPGQTVRFKVQISEQGKAAANATFGYKVSPLLAMTTAGESLVGERGGESDLFRKQNAESADAPVADAKEGEEAGKERRSKAALGSLRSKIAPDTPAEPAPAPAAAAGALGPVAQGGAQPEGARNGALAEGLPFAPLVDSSDRFGEVGNEFEYLLYDQLAAEQPAQPMLLASNEDAVRESLDEQRAAEAARLARLARWQHWLAKGLLIGGVVLLVVLGVAVYRQRPASPRAWVPSLVIAAASFLVGMVWLIQQTPPAAQTIAKRSTTMADREMPPPMSMSTGVDVGAAPADDESGAMDAPAPVAADTTAQFGAGFAGGMGGAGGGGFGGGKRGDDVREMPSAEAARSEPALPGSGSGRTESLSDLAKRAGTVERAPDAAAKGAQVAPPRDVADPQEKKLAASDSPKDDASELKDRLNRDKSASPLSEPASESPARNRAARPVRRENETVKEADKSLAKNAKDEKKSELGLEVGQKGERLKAETPGQERPAAIADAAPLLKTLGDGEARAAGTVWVPLLAADENGEAVIEFTMPSEPGNYKLILDVLGPGRSSQIERLIRCEVPQPAAPAPPEPSEPKR